MAELDNQCPARQVSRMANTVLRKRFHPLVLPGRSSQPGDRSGTPFRLHSNPAGVSAYCNHPIIQQIRCAIGITVDTHLSMRLFQFQGAHQALFLNGNSVEGNEGNDW